MSGRLLLDSANLGDIRRISHTDAIAGVTTNPSLIAKTEKGDYIERLELIAKILGQGCHQKNVNRKHLSVEVITTDPHRMFIQAKKIAERLKDYAQWIDLHVKIPVTVDTLRVITDLERGWHVNVNATACMMPSQAKMAMDAGASVVSFFYNRMKDGGDVSPSYTIREFAELRPRQDLLMTTSFVPERGLSNYDCQIICGSIRKPEDVMLCWDAGADFVTVGMHIIELFMKHPQTDLVIENFQRDIDGWLE